MLKTSSEHKPSSRKKDRLTKEERIELRGLPKLIDQLEKKKAQVEKKLQDPTLYSGKDFQKINDLKSQESALETDIINAYTRWETLEAKNN